MNILKNIFWMLSEKVTRLILSIVTSALIARYLGPEEFGELNYYIALLAIAIVLSSVGFNRIIVRDIVQAKNDRHEQNIIISTALFMRLLFSFIIIVILYSFFYFSGKGMFISSVIFLSLIFSSFDVLDFHQQGLSSFKQVSICRTIAFFISSLIRLVLVYYSFGLIWFFLAVIVEYAITAIGLIFITYKNKIIHFFSFKFVSVSKAKVLIQESWPEIIAGFGAVLFMKMDQLMLQVMHGSESVGIYSAATRISEAWYFVPVAVVSATFPKIIELKKKSEAEYYSAIAALSSVLIYMALFVAVFFSVYGGDIIDVIYGKEYSDSSMIIIWHTWGAIFLCMGITSGSWLAAEKKLNINLYRNIFGLIINFIFNVILIPIWGPQGAAISTVIGLASAFYLFDLFLPSLRPIFLIKTKSIFPTELYKCILLLVKLKN
ncbi:flippase [Pectobacterium brasiliense]|uniref:flippase n=1 Tax=Pectobacterium brasiliense TaxID=180957 RepID=UPI001D0D278F|nr:flippase [Pectobacterium brasiliense]UDQ77209.1 flippase [Pectobacterium brasiliense]